MKRKLISCYSYGVVAISAMAVPFLSLYDMKFWPACIWAVGLMAAMVGMIWLMNTEEYPKKKRMFMNYDLLGERKCRNRI